MSYKKKSKLKYFYLNKIIIFSLIVLISQTTIAENTWNVKDIENTDTIGEIFYLSMKLDSFDNPHICYVDRTYNITKNYNFYYLYKNNGTWIKEVIDTNDFVGFYCSMDLDQKNKPHISYYDQLNGDLKYAEKIGDKWKIETIDTEGDTGYYSSLKIDNDNNIHIAYYKEGTMPYGLKYAYYNETNNWKIEQIDSGSKVGLDTSIDVDSINNPRISYFDYYHNNNSLRYAYKQDNKWFFRTVDYEGDVGYSSSLKIDKENIPHITYYDATNNKIKYAYLKDDTWVNQTIDAESGTALGESFLSLDEEDNPHIVYNIAANEKQIKYAYWTGYEWEIQEIDEGIIPILDLSTKNSPYIIYKDTSNDILIEATPSMMMTSPKGGETWYKNEIYDIKWNTNDQDNQYLKIDLLTNGNVYTTIAENYSNTGLYAWNITDEIESNQYTIKISNNEGNIFAEKIINIKNKETKKISENSFIPIFIIIILILILLVSILYYKKKKK